MTAKTFFNELQHLLYSQPKAETLVRNSENCFYGDHIYNSKNLSYCFDTSASSDALYLFDSHMVANSMDCDYTVESESCYESVDLFKCFNCYYGDKLDNTRDTMYCSNLSNCHNMFGCTNLKNKSYCIFNRQFTKDEYDKLVKKYKKVNAEKNLKVLDELKIRYPITQSSAERNINTPYGNFIYDCKNCYMCFDVARSEECYYLFDSYDDSTSMDMTYSDKGCDNSYQIVDSIKIYNSQFIQSSENCQDSFYLFNCKGVKNSLGCVGIQYKEHCILNRQFTKDEYDKISFEIRKTLSETDVNWSTIIV